MSFSFSVPVSEAVPSFADVVKHADLPFSLELAMTSGGITWPMGKLRRYIDLVMPPNGEMPRSELTGNVDEHDENQSPGSFLVYNSEGSVRGVEISRSSHRVNFRVCVLASVLDYMIAIRLAASLAKQVHTLVQAEHGPDQEEIEPLTADLLLATFNEKILQKFVEMINQATSSASKGRSNPIFFETPYGWVQLDKIYPAHLTPSTISQAAQHQCMPPTFLKDNHAKRFDALLLTFSMLNATGADGKLSQKELLQLDSHMKLVPELRLHEPNQLIREVQEGVVSVSDLEEATDELKQRAFVLAAEIVACSTEGRLAGDAEHDPNVRVILQLAKLLRLSEGFVKQVILALAAKFTPLTDLTLRCPMVEGMVAAIAAAHQPICDVEFKLMQSFLTTIPSFDEPTSFALLTEAIGRLHQGGLVSLQRDLAKLTQSRNRCFALALETLAFICGENSARQTVAELVAWIRPPNPEMQEAIRTVVGVKYGIKL